MLLSAIPLLAACGPQEVKQPPDPVTLQIKWVHQAQSAGFYVAQERGYYAAEDIAVTFLEGGPDIDPIERVVTGQADFGVTTPMDVLQHRSQGEPVVAIATLFRRDPMVFLSLEGSGIERPTDFAGRTVALGTAEGKLRFAAMMTRLGLDIGQVRVVPYQYDFTPFYNGEADITEAYMSAGLVRIRRKGYKVNVIWPGDYGMHLYGDTVITTERMIAENPDLVTRFLRATLRGWRETIEDPAAAVAITLEYAREVDSELQTEMMEASVPLIHTGEDQIGWMQAGVWERTHRLLLEGGLLGGPVDPDKAYTMEFLQRIYGGE